MRMYVCTFPRMRTLRILCAAFSLVTLGLVSPAQDGQTNTGTAKSGLQINAIVVPAVAPPRHHRHRDRDRDRDDEAVTYNLDPQRERVSVTEEVRPMLVQEGSSVPRQEQVRIVTVVAR
jgi:hypothetical protein